MKYYVLVNPKGGIKKGPGILQNVRPLFNAANAELNVIETEYAGHGRELAKTLDFEGYDGLCAVGGDGTMHEIINGLMNRADGRKIPIGLITGGTGNSFMHDVDCLDPKQAVQRILTDKRRTIDVAKVDASGEIIYAFNIVGWGMPTDINEIAEKLRWLGGQRYNIASLIEIMRFRQRLATLELEGNIKEGDFGFVIGCNTIHTGRGMKMAPHAQLNDGLIDVIVAHKSSRLKLLKMFPKVFSGEHIDDPIVEYHQVKKFSIIPQAQDKLNIDGEIIGSTPVNVEVLQSAVEVLV